MTPTPPPCEARAARPEELDTSLHVLCEAFHLDYDAARPLFYQDPFFDLSHKRILVTPAAGLVSCLTVIPSSLRVGGTVIPMGGIAGVATRPDCQRRGYAGALLSATVGALAEELGYPLSALFPYSYHYYRPFGWATASQSARWTASPTSLPAYSESSHVRPVRTDEDRAAVHALHARLTAARTGAGGRDARRWHIIDVLAQGREIVIYDDASGCLGGYLAYEPGQAEGDARPPFRILEMHAATAAARRGLVGFLARPGADCARWEWPAALTDLRAFGLDRAGDEPTADPPSLTWEPGMMLRIVNLPQALSCLHPELAPALAETGRTLTVRATDTLRPSNETPVRLTARGVGTGDTEDADWVAADIGVLAQLYSGYQTPQQAASLGHLQASSAEALALAGRLFPARDPYIAPPDQF